MIKSLELLLIILIFALGLQVGLYRGMAYTRDLAVKNNVAEYYLDDNHERQFRWKE